MPASIWNPGGSLIPQADPNIQISSESFIATEGQTLFNLSLFTYSLGNGALSVFVNGSKQRKTEVIESSTSSFTISACNALDVVEAVGNSAIADPTGAAYDAGVSAASAAASALAADTSADIAVAAEASVTSMAGSVATLYDSFDDRFLGAKAAAPALDNDGNALVTGAIYFNTTSNVMYVWTGAAWMRSAASPTPQTLVDASPVVWDWSLGNAKLSIAANRVLSNPTNAADGQYCTVRVTRATTHTISFDTKFKGVTGIVQSNTAGLKDHFVFRYDAASDVFELVAFRANIGA